MSGKSVKIVKRAVRKEKNSIANQLIVELMSAPFRYRLKFALRLIRGAKGLDKRHK